MYFFEEGKNSYTVKIDDRTTLITQKIKLSRKLLKRKDYNRALQLIKDGIDLCDNGLFDEDKPLVRPNYLSNLKNQSLCHLKLGSWRLLEESVGEYIDVKLRRKKKKNDNMREGKIGDGAQTINLMHSNARKQGDNARWGYSNWKLDISFDLFDYDDCRILVIRTIF